MKNQLISCIVPVYNCELYLREALESIFAQTYRPIEVIVVDDGSNDGTAAILESYGDKITVCRQTNAGPAAARNQGVNNASGDFIAFLDADDKWNKEKLTLQMQFLHSMPRLDACVTHIQNFWIPELIEEERLLQNNPISKPVPGYLTQTLLAKRKAIDLVGGFNTNAGAGDATDWFLRAGDNGLVCELMPETLVYRRLHRNNRSRYLGSLPKTVLLKFLKDSLDRKRKS